MGLKTGLSPWEKKGDRECWGEHEDLRRRSNRYGGNCIMRNFIICTLHKILIGWSNQGGWNGRGMKHERERWYGIVVGESKWKRSLGRSSSRWKNNIRIRLKQTVCEVALVTMLMDFWVPWKAMNFLTSWATTCFSSRALIHWVTYLVYWNVYCAKRQFTLNIWENKSSLSVRHFVSRAREAVIIKE